MGGAYDKLNRFRKELNTIEFRKEKKRLIQYSKNTELVTMQLLHIKRKFMEIRILKSQSNIKTGQKNAQHQWL